MYEYTQLLVSRADIFLFQVFPEVVALRVLQGMPVSLVFLVVVVVEAVVQELQVVEAEARGLLGIWVWLVVKLVRGQQGFLVVLFVPQGVAVLWDPQEILVVPFVVEGLLLYSRQLPIVLVAVWQTKAFQVAFLLNSVRELVMPPAFVVVAVLVQDPEHLPVFLVLPLTLLLQHHPVIRLVLGVLAKVQ